RPRLRDRVAGGARARHLQPELGTARRTRVGLGMEPPARRDVVLLGAPRAHGKGAHRGRGPVIGERLDDGEARPAARAVDEGIAVASVGRIEQLAQAVRTGGRVGGHWERFAGDRQALVDLERASAGEGDRDCPQLLDACEGWRVRPEAFAERRDGGWRPLHLDLDPARAIADPASEPVVRGEPVHEGAEADSLHGAAHVDALPNRLFGQLLGPRCHWSTSLALGHHALSRLRASPGPSRILHRPSRYRLPYGWPSKILLVFHRCQWLGFARTWRERGWPWFDASTVPTRPIGRWGYVFLAFSSRGRRAPVPPIRRSQS